jgi:REP element-mobilizing transposase RayT
MRRPKPKPTPQLDLPLPKPRNTWGGKRTGAGRKADKNVAPHVRRPFHEHRHPVHITVRTLKAVGSLRTWRTAAAIGRAIRSASLDGGAAEQRRKSFRVVHFSIQRDHMHLIVEASSKRALSTGMQGLASRLARRINRTRRRRGTVFSERYHARALATPLEVRRAIAYVLTNVVKHPELIPDLGTATVDGIDPCSSARWFDGWERPPPPDPKPAPTAAPATWLLRTGWRRHGLVSRDERPALG